MNKEAQKMVERLNKVYVDRDELNRVCKDRLDFGFDSIYFRYAEALDELAAYKAMVERTDPIQVRKQLSHRKHHFYMTLEQLVHAHDQEEDKNDFNS